MNKNRTLNHIRVATEFKTVAALLSQPHKVKIIASFDNLTLSTSIALKDVLSTASEFWRLHKEEFYHHRQDNFLEMVAVCCYLKPENKQNLTFKNQFLAALATQKLTLRQMASGVVFNRIFVQGETAHINTKLLSHKFLRRKRGLDDD